MDTIDTTRIYADDPFSLAVRTSHIGFPDRNVPWKPNAVILCPAHDYRFAFAAAGLIHQPLGAPILFVERFMPAVTRQELIRLAPSGEQSPAQVLLVGPVPDQVEQDIRHLGMTTLRVGNRDPAYTACAAAELREEITRMANMPLNKNYMIISGETFSEALPAPGYSAHSGTPILFTARNGLPATSAEWIRRHPDWNGYLLGSKQTIGESVESEVRELSQGKLKRIKGADPFELSVHFAAFHDPETRFGWNRNKKGMGDAFTFVPFHSWHHAIAGLIFSHIGKHTPVLVVEPSSVPQAIQQYLLALNPVRPEPPMPPFMHGFVIGKYTDISFGVQVELEKRLILMAGDLEHMNMM